VAEHTTIGSAGSSNPIVWPTEVRIVVGPVAWGNVEALIRASWGWDVPPHVRSIEFVLNDQEADRG